MYSASAGLYHGLLYDLCCPPRVLDLPTRIIFLTKEGPLLPDSKRQFPKVSVEHSP